MFDGYADLYAGLVKLPADDRGSLGNVFLILICQGPPASVAFLETLALALFVPATEGHPGENTDELTDTLDAIPTGEFLSLCAVFSEMAENRPETQGAWLKLLGLEFGASIRRRQAARGPLDPETEAFLEAITGYFMEEE